MGDTVTLPFFSVPLAAGSPLSAQSPVASPSKLSSTCRWVPVGVDGCDKCRCVPMGADGDVCQWVPMGVMGADGCDGCRRVQCMLMSTNCAGSSGRPLCRAAGSARLVSIALLFCSELS